MNFAQPYHDLREFIGELEKHEKLYRIKREINKDSELQPLVRWQFRGGSPEERRGFLFNNVVDGKGRKYNCSVLVGGLSGRKDLFAGAQCEPEEIADRWNHAQRIRSRQYGRQGPVQEEVHMGARSLMAALGSSRSDFDAGF